MTTSKIHPTALPENAVALFKLYVADAGNWSGTPLVGGNVTLLGDKEDRGLLSYLKRAGVVTTTQDSDNKRCFWLYFTKAGFDFAKTLGLDVDENELSGYRGGWPDKVTT